MVINYLFIWRFKIVYFKFKITLQMVHALTSFLVCFRRFSFRLEQMLRMKKNIITDHNGEEY